MKPCQHLNGVQRFDHDTHAGDREWRDVCRDCHAVLAKSKPIKPGDEWVTLDLEPGHPLAGGGEIDREKFKRSFGMTFEEWAALPDMGIQDL